MVDQNLGQLFNEERDSVGPLDDLIDSSPRQRLVARGRRLILRFVLSISDRG